MQSYRRVYKTAHPFLEKLDVRQVSELLYCIRETSIDDVDTLLHKDKIPPSQLVAFYTVCAPLAFKHSSESSVVSFDISRSSLWGPMIDGLKGIEKAALDLKGIEKIESIYSVSFNFKKQSDRSSLRTCLQCDAHGMVILLYRRI